MPAPTKQAPATETDLEINPCQPPFEAPEYSTPDTYWAKKAQEHDRCASP